MSTYPEPEPCKHCEDLIQRSDKAGGDYLHTTGHYAGRHNCATDPYGYHAEPVDTPCRADGPNPCRGGREGGAPHPSKAQDEVERRRWYGDAYSDDDGTDQ